MKRIVAVIALVVVAAAGAACVRRPMRGQEANGLDRKLSTFVWVEDGDIATLLVGTRATRYREEDAYIPIEVAFANTGLRQIALSRESFVLVDEEGNRYPAAGPKELLDEYDFLDLDRRLQEIEGVTFNRFATYTIYPSKFSPTRRGPTRPGESSLVRDSITLPKFGYLIDFVYFPKPVTGVMGRKFELFVSAPELTNPIFVKFEVK
jgi:hypothetical protein